MTGEGHELVRRATYLLEQCVDNGVVAAGCRPHERRAAVAGCKARIGAVFCEKARWGE